VTLLFQKQYGLLTDAIKNMAKNKKLSETIIIEMLWDKVQKEECKPLKPLPVLQRCSFNKKEGLYA
jgi:hypothetical protein